MKEAAVAVSGLSKRFGEQTAVESLDFAVNRGEIFGLVGPDGAGKTTTMRMLASVSRPDTGNVVIDGVDVKGHPERTKHHISYMPQRFGLYEDLTVDENIRFYADLFEVDDNLWKSRAQSLLAMSGMTEFRDRLAGQLSGGMKQKLGLTCSLVHAPRVLLLDEPTTGVDPVSRREFWQILYSLRAEGAAILISTAYLDEAERCDRLALMSQGRILYCDTPAKLKARMPGAMLQILCSNPSAVREIVKSQPGVLGVLIVGIGIHVHVDDAARRLPALQAALSQREIPVSGIEEISPSIEDLFVALLDTEKSREQ